MVYQRRDEKRDSKSQINARVTSKELSEVKEAAQLYGLSVSEYTRRKLLGLRLPKPKSDAAMIRELNRLGGLLKLVHTESNGIYSKDTAEAIQAIRKYIEVLSDDREKD